MDAAYILRRAADLADQYDRHACGDVRFNNTDAFHLCGMIERAASLPKSGATHRRSVGPDAIAQAKALFCLTHRTIHPAAWEMERKRSCEEVRQALLNASEVEQEWRND